MDFEEFWSEYPKKVAKKAAIKAWKKLKPEERFAVKEAINKHKKFWVLRETSIDYIPHASTWLNQGRWDDVLEFVAPKVTNKQMSLEDRNRQIALEWARSRP
jgi:hypothetical protein